MGIPRRDPSPHRERADSAARVVAGEVASTAVPTDGLHGSSPAGRSARADWPHVGSCGVVAASGHFERSAPAIGMEPVQPLEAENEGFAHS